MYTNKHKAHAHVSTHRGSHRAVIEVEVKVKVIKAVPAEKQLLPPSSQPFKSVGIEETLILTHHFGKITIQVACEIKVMTFNHTLSCLSLSALVNGPFCRNKCKQVEKVSIKDLKVTVKSNREGGAPFKMRGDIPLCPGLLIYKICSLWHCRKLPVCSFNNVWGEMLSGIHLPPFFCRVPAPKTSRAVINAYMNE